MAFIYFDVANTLLHKPAVYDAIMAVLERNGFSTDRDELVRRHKLLSEVIKFPDKTSKDFYTIFNAELLRSLGIAYDASLLDELFESCKYKSWEKFSDTDIISSLPFEKGIISNWDTSIAQHIDEYFPNVFGPVISSMIAGVAKPDPRIYQMAVDACKVEPASIYYIGDSIKLDIEPAVAMGMRAILVDRLGLYPHSNHYTKISSLSELGKIILS